MKLILCTNRWGFLLRFLMWSRWSHSAILDEETNIVYDSTLTGGGVRAREAGYFLEHYPQHEVRDITVATERLKESRVWLREQVGKPYDWTALLSWIVRRDWQRPDWGFCSEFSESYIGRFSTPRFRESVSRITPRHQDMLV